jgi:hypothetical protein
MFRKRKMKPLDLAAESCVSGAAEIKRMKSESEESDKTPEQKWPTADELAALDWMGWKKRSQRKKKRRLHPNQKRPSIRSASNMKRKLTMEPSNTTEAISNSLACLVDTPPDFSVAAQEQKSPTAQEAKLVLRYTGVSGAIGQYPTTEALRALSDTGIRGSAMFLLLPIVHNLECQLEAATKELKELREMYHQECIKTSKLEQELEGAKKLKVLQNVLLTGGGILNTVGVKLILDQQHVPAALLITVGVLLLFAGWLWSFGGKKK